MSPPFALDLSLDGIRLLFRAEGGWTVVGDVTLEDPALAARLADFRTAARSIAPGALATELVIPPSQIRYATVPRPHAGPITADDILPLLDGLTPLAPEELVFDWAEDGDDIRLALVDTLTLSEAEAFAAAHRFNPVAFGARPTPAQFPRPVDFGPTARAAAAADATRVADTAEPALAFSSVRAAAGAPAEPGIPDLRGNLTLATMAAPETAAAPPPPEADAPEAAAALPAPEDLARTLTAPPPVNLAEPAAPLPADDATAAAEVPGAAAALARTLVAERSVPTPRAPARRSRAPLARPGARRIAMAGGGLAAAVVLALGVAMTRDPAASLPDTPPEVALAAPALDAPDGAAPAAAPAAPATEAGAAPAPLAAAAIAAPDTSADPVADTAAPATLDDEAPSRLVASAPAGLPLPATEGTETIYLASIDRATASRDAIALLPAARFASSPRPASSLSPAPAGASFDRGADGLVVATPEGALTPDGVVVRLGAPPLAPPPAPNRPAAAPAAADAAGVVVATAEPEVRPRARPEGLVERFERATLGGRTRAELAALKPQARPVSEQARAVAAAPAAPSDYAVAVSVAPRDRPADLATRVATASAVAAALATPPAPPAPEPAPVVVAAAPATSPAPAPAREEPPARAEASEADEYADGEPETASVAPAIPTTASVARQATLRNAMDLGDVNLIGVYGTERDRRALVRLPSGRMVKVEVGDRLDGGRIAAIGRDELRYTKGGRDITIEVPSG
jgi:hypothetical protein